jgi:uncharacterized coiled-coil DUF342 family protein
MKLETIVTLLGIATALLVLVQGYDWWKKRQNKSSTDVVSSAMQLLTPYQVEVDRLRASLGKANDQILDLTVKLNNAETRADNLNNQLVDAQTEVGYLRTQVKVLSQQLRNNPNETS